LFAEEWRVGLLDVGGLWEGELVICGHGNLICVGHEIINKIAVLVKGSRWCIVELNNISCTILFGLFFANAYFNIIIMHFSEGDLTKKNWSLWINLEEGDVF
jgi:hypothetical protein